MFIWIFCGLFGGFVFLSDRWNTTENQNLALSNAKEKVQNAIFALKHIDLAKITQDPQIFCEGLGVGLLVEGYGELISSCAPSLPQDKYEVISQEILIGEKKITVWASPNLKKSYADLLILVMFMLSVLCVFGILYWIFQRQFESILSFSKNQKKSTLFSFDEVKVFSKQLNRLEKILFKREQKASKQAQKIKLKNTQLSNLISAISHELKNPLSIIQLSLDALKNPKLTQKDLFEQKIHHQVVRLNQLTHKLNFVFNLDVKQLQLEEFDLFETARRVILAQGNDRIELLGEKTWVRGDVFLIEQVMINLISNALKYSQREILIEVKNQKFKITDYGEGIAPDQIKKITKKFYKINAENENSFGLGLFIIKRILALHQSHLKIKSKLGEGSHFSFKLEG
ncbi:sensor histidine kinase [Helicobacter pametensis]|uniref:sensor histidine kinase n=1 Tax=Helicobacter pametensis TaxID=95149 RepID=UPI000686F730|nr:HAMP domain-containing sensor histidine kinase [Helicobacter pametensis]